MDVTANCQPIQNQLMTADYLVDLYTKLEQSGINIWIDGGWGVDALLGEQTRPHDDLDIVVEEKNLPELREYLQAQRYKDVERDDTSPWNFVLGDDNGHEIDFHVVNFDDEGNGIYGPEERGIMYPADSFEGIGYVNGVAIRCLTAEYQVKSHTGYELREKDYRDVAALCEKFGIELPDEYTQKSTGG